MQIHTQLPEPAITLINRSVDFQFDQVESIWLKNTIKTQFMHGLSLLVPVSERAVIEILRKQLTPHTSPNIQCLIKGVIKQEGQHAAMHRRANSVIFKSHPELKWVTSIQTGFMKLVRKISSPAFELAIPVAFEHITAAISKDVLTHQDYWFAQDHNRKIKPNKNAIDFLLWHCLEELEHQAVCHKIYKHQYKSQWRVILCLFMFWLPITIASVFTVQFYLLIKDKTLLKPNNWPSYVWFIGRSFHLFMKGILKYRHKDYSVWSPEDLALYEAACQAFNNRQSS